MPQNSNSSKMLLHHRIQVIRSNAGIKCETIGVEAIAIYPPIQIIFQRTPGLVLCKQVFSSTYLANNNSTYKRKSLQKKANPTQFPVFPPIYFSHSNQIRILHWDMSILTVNFQRNWILCNWKLKTRNLKCKLQE